MEHVQARLRLQDLVALVTLMGLSALHALHFSHIPDDAYISFRYASNLASGVFFRPFRRRGPRRSTPDHPPEKATRAHLRSRPPAGCD